MHHALKSFLWSLGPSLGLQNYRCSNVGSFRYFIHPFFTSIDPPMLHSSLEVYELICGTICAQDYIIIHI